MEKIIMLGTGHGSVMNSYNTCFLLEFNGQNLLVDTGGSIQIIKNLQSKGYKLTDIQNIFISHCHNDHILGLFWILKKMSVLFLNGEYKEKLNVYCNSEVAESIKKISEAVFPDILQKTLQENVSIHILHDGETVRIANENITFFDVHAKGNKLYGFQTILNSGAKLIFLGDETCNPCIYDKLKGADYVMHEAFCLDSEENIPKVVKEHHATVKSVCESLEPLDIKNLIIYHTEDSHKNKKQLYTEEAKRYFSGNIIVPNDLEEIVLRMDIPKKDNNSKKYVRDRRA